MASLTCQPSWYVCELQPHYTPVSTVYFPVSARCQSTSDLWPCSRERVLSVSVAGCSWIPMRLICRPCLPTHFIRPVSPTDIFLEFCSLCTRQQQLHLSVISFRKRWVAYNVHNKVTPGSYWWSQVRGKCMRAPCGKCKCIPKHIRQWTLPPGPQHMKVHWQIKRHKRMKWVMGL